jgi:hypothetical protein
LAEKRVSDELKLWRVRQQQSAASNSSKFVEIRRFMAEQQLPAFLTGALSLKQPDERTSQSSLWQLAVLRKL